MSETVFDAIVLAGGTSRRMGGGDKTALLVGGATLLDRTIAAVAGARQVIAVGVERPTALVVRWTGEQPVGGGPAAALVAGLACVSAPLVAVLAGDLPFVIPQTVQRLLAAAEPAGAVLVDSSGAPQWLLGAWPAELLRGAFAGDQSGASLRRALAPLQPALLASVAERPEWFDCDEPADLTAAKEMAE